MRTIDMSSTVQKLSKNKYVLMVFALGMLLILLPSSSKKNENSGNTVYTLEATGVSLATESGKVADIMSEIDGVGRAEVLLSRNGAVIVCDGADSAKVRLLVTNAVMAYTGLGSDKIWVVKMK